MGQAMNDAGEVRAEELYIAKNTDAQARKGFWCSISFGPILHFCPWHLQSPASNVGASLLSTFEFPWPEYLLERR